MSLDQNLFTLIFTPNKHHPNVTDLVDPSENVHYHKRRVPGQEYKIEVFDPLSESLLITATAPSPSSKVKILELYNPSSVVEIKSTGTLSFRWSFKWEEHDFEWKREQCFLIRKPDPPVLVAVTKEQNRQVKNTQVQILDYNIQRFDIDDRKGLEIVILTALMTFHDMSDTVPSVSSPVTEAPPASLQTPPQSLSRRVSGLMSFNNEAPPPPTPPKPAPRTGLDRIREMQEMKGEDYNEITVEGEGSVEDYAQYCSDLLSDDSMLFISVKSSSAEFVSKVLQVVEEAKRTRYKAGMDDEAELHQYVLYDTEKKKGPKRINLNDDAKQKEKYAPPESLLVHLSKIDMPELAPKSAVGTIKGRDNKVTTANSITTTQSSSSTAPSRQSTPSRPPKSTPSPPLTSPATPSGTGSSSFFGLKQKQPKNKLTKAAKERPVSTPPPAPNPQPPLPPTGLLNSHPPASSPAFPMPYGSGGKSRSGGGDLHFETPGLGLHNSFMPPTPGPPPPQHPPPPPPQQPYGQGSSSGSNRPLSTVGGIAETVVSGIFGMAKNASSRVKK